MKKKPNAIVKMFMVFRSHPNVVIGGSSPIAMEAIGHGPEESNPQYH
jgi:hypothetical protein